VAAPATPLKVMFAVQGEGRGHMTQAIAMSDMLQRRGHRVVAVVVGANRVRTLPAYFEQAFAVPIRQVASPGFVLKKSRAISLVKTCVLPIASLPAYRRSLRVLDDTIQSAQPDLIVSFFESLMGVYNLLRRQRVPVLSVGHQFMIDHPQFVRIKEYRVQRFAMRRFVRLAGARSAHLALSFYPAPDIPERRIFVSPPILRRQLFDLRPDTSGGYLLVYLLNHGYAAEIIRWHEQHREIPIHCFYDKPGAPSEEPYDAGLTFHLIHGEKFMRMMASCRGMASTAGFETVCEAAYLGKPLLLVPVGNHVEQYLNGCDAEKAGIAVRDTAFNLSRLLEPAKQEAISAFRRWVDQAETLAMRAVELTAAGDTQGA
jgi:uncharacterized protein (TIGR00661 family)